MANDLTEVFPKMKALVDAAASVATPDNPTGFCMEHGEVRGITYLDTYRCTLPKGHTGPHAGHSITGQIVHTWQAK